MSKSHRFTNLGFEDFRKLACDPQLSPYEKIGFPDTYRAGHETEIFRDICRKLSHLERPAQRVLDIGPGCSGLPKQLIAYCRKQRSPLHLIDSAEMLAHLPDDEGVFKHPGIFPNCPEFLAAHQEQLDVILCYSVLHYVLIDVAFFRFLDHALSLLAPTGQFLIGDIPNVSKRKRFFASATGVAFHQQFMDTQEEPEVHYQAIEHDQIDDAVLMAIVQRARLQGFDAYLLPQHAALPMANRREDILIVRP